LEPMVLRGLDEPVQAYRVRMPLGDVLGLPPALDATPRFDFVGRADELATIELAWASARDRRGGLGVVAGDPGAGKTRGCREFAPGAREAGAVVLHGACAEHGGAAFQPFVQALRTCLTSVGDARAVVGPGAAHLVRLVPELAARLPDLGEVPTSDP